MIVATQTRYRSYGRRKGHALRRHHLQLVDTLLPNLRIDPKQLTLDKDRETWLEIGFGGGEHLAHQAEAHRDIQFIGAEFFINGVAKLLALIEEKQLANVSIHDGDARTLLDVLPDQCLTRIYLLYPDPWPKERHKKRRFVSLQNLQQFSRLLKPGGLFVFASDIPDYVNWTQTMLLDFRGFELSNRDHSQPPENWVSTRYETKAKSAGRSPSYLIYQRL